MKANIKLSLYKLNAVRLLALLRNVIAKLTGNAFFPAPPETIANMITLGDQLEAAIEEATEGSKASRGVRKARVLEARELLRITADYVRMVAKGDETKLLTSGFEMAKQPEPVGVPGVTRYLHANFTNSAGVVELRWRTVHGARGYQVWMSTTDPGVEANWEAIGYATRASHTVTDLESYRPYWFCVSAIGSEGEGLKCDPALGRAA